MAKKKVVVPIFEPNFEPKSLVAKKAFKIVHNDYERDIKVGDNLDDIPEIYIPNLKAENVID